MKITVGFSKHLGFAPMSSAIRWYFNDDFSHTYFKVSLPGLQDSSVFQATGKGIGICSYSNFKLHNIIIKEFEIEISEELFLEIYNEFHNKAGTKYGYVQNLGILVVKELKKLNVNLKVNPFQDGIICSEYVAYCLEEIYPKDWNSGIQDFNLVTPNDTYNYLLKNEAKING